MKKLSKNWITEGLMDFEYKKYILLAYLQQVKESYKNQKLYPSLAEVIEHHRNLIQLAENKTGLAQQFPKKLTEIDWKRLKLNYKDLVEDECFMRELEDIIQYAIPHLKSKIDEGVDLFEIVEEQLKIQPVGIASLYNKEGYFFLDFEGDPFLQVYQYRLSFFEATEERYQSLQTTFLQRIRKSIGRTFEQIKLELNRQYQFFSNPSTYHVFSLTRFPHEETLMPVLKRSFVRYLAESK